MVKTKSFIWFFRFFLANTIFPCRRIFILFGMWYLESHGLHSGQKHGRLVIFWAYFPIGPPRKICDAHGYLRASDIGWTYYFDCVVLLMRRVYFWQYRGPILRTRKRNNATTKRLLGFLKLLTTIIESIAIPKLNVVIVTVSVYTTCLASTQNACETRSVHLKNVLKNTRRNLEVTANAIQSVPLLWLLDMFIFQLLKEEQQCNFWGCTLLLFK